MSIEDGPARPELPPRLSFEVIDAALAGEPAPVAPVPAPSEPALPRRRKILLPVVLFLATCVSMFLVEVRIGAVMPNRSPNHVEPLGKYLMVYWGDVVYRMDWVKPLTYMLAGMAVLLSHEMGHFLQAVRYRVIADLPYFIPMPISPLGTMGAFIRMRGSVADRKQMFDIGLTGPLAGLVVALPLCWIGIQDAPLVPPNTPGEHYPDPLLFKVLIAHLRPDIAPGQELELTPLLRACWMAMLITGLNMLPVSQLDGGHVAYALFGRRADVLAWLMIAVAILYIVLARQMAWILMLILVLFVIGPTHPPTANDSVPLGWGRKLLGIASLTIPIFCFMPDPIPFRTEGPQAPRQKLPDTSQRWVWEGHEPRELRPVKGAMK